MAGRLKLILKFQVMTRLLLARKRLYAALGGRFWRDRIMVNLGGGLFFRPGWRVMDFISPYYPFARRYVDDDIDLFDEPRFPFEDGTVSFFYSAHTLEHIPQEHCPNVFREMHRCLKPGGAVRLNMPDFDMIRDAFERDDRAFFAIQLDSGITMEEALIQRFATELVGRVDSAEIRDSFERLPTAEFADRYAARASRDVQREKGGFHINWFNYDKLSAMLADAGFANIERSRPQGSRFRELRGNGGVLALGNLFEIDRMLGIDTTHPSTSLYVEAVK